MFFSKMSLRGKIASAIIGIILLAILISIGSTIYRNVVKATHTSANLELNTNSEEKEQEDFWNIKTENEDDDKSEKDNQIAKNESDVSENVVVKNEAVENKTQEKNETIENKTSENKTSENKTSENKTSENKTNENSATKNNEKSKEKTSATEGTKGTIYLTFDDGPSTKITPKILDILKQENVKATFFILNYNADGEKIIKRAYAEGHTIGIHGYSHKYSEIYQTENTYMQNLNKLQEKIEKSIGFKSRVTRFPGGSSNTISKKYNVGIMSRLVKKVEANGYKYYDWNIDSGDAASAKTSAKIFSNVTKNLSKKRPNVVLMHDFANGKKTADALRDIIKYGKSNGYEFKNITYDGNLVVHHNVNN